MGADAPLLRATPPPEPHPTLDRLLADAPPTDPAVVDGSVRRSFAGLTATASAVAGAWQALGIERGDVVAWQLPNWHESVVCFHACWLLGAVAVPLHHRGGADEVARRLDLLQPGLVLAAPGLPAASAAGSIEVRGDGGYESLLAHPAAQPASIAPDDRAVVLFTAGSSRAPKGAVHTHRSLSHKARSMAAVHGLDRNDVVLMPAPLAHVSGLLNAVLLPAAVGMKVVLMDRWEPSTALDLIETERVSYMVGPPTFFLSLLEEPGFSAERVASIRVISCGGTDVTAAFVHRAEAAFGARVKRSYGSTEAPTVTTWHVGDPPDRAAKSDGRAVGGVELKVTDPATGREVAAGERGELWVRGTEVFAGYIDGGGDGDSALVDGWFRTGDLVNIDKDGWLTVVGRTTAVIIRGGENISPGEVEATLEAHADISAAVAVGLPDERLGETVAALVVADRDVDADSCRTWFDEHGVARFKAPERLLRVPELPLLPSGKPDRRAARDMLLSTPAKL